VLQICDFGLAKWKEHAATQTTTERQHGTVAYMAPEVLRDPSMSRTTKYDVYAFGILLWKLLAGQKPYKNGTGFLSNPIQSKFIKHQISFKNIFS